MRRLRHSNYLGSPFDLFQRVSLRLVSSWCFSFHFISSRLVVSRFVTKRNQFRRRVHLICNSTRTFRSQLTVAPPKTELGSVETSRDLRRQISKEPKTPSDCVYRSPAAACSSAQHFANSSMKFDPLDRQQVAPIAQLCRQAPTELICIATAQECAAQHQPIDS